MYWYVASCYPGKTALTETWIPKATLPDLLQGAVERRNLDPSQPIAQIPAGLESYVPKGQQVYLIRLVRTDGDRDLFGTYRF